MQDGARWHTAATSLQGLRDHQVNFWGKEEWPPNLSNLNPIENLWSMLKEIMKSGKNQPQNVAQLEKLLKRSWRNISLETLENLVSNTNSIKRCLL